METLLLDILSNLRTAESLDDRSLAAIIRRHNKGLRDGERPYAKKRLLPYYLKIRESDPERWSSWNVDHATEERLLEALRMKPRRTASGVATITVITKPWTCSNSCLYCPNDVRMPKSYLSDEPACQRAEQNYFDPYLQVAARLHALEEMGHPTDKIELIVLGGTWSDYPLPYQIWFVKELFRALNDGNAERNARERRGSYRERGFWDRPCEHAKLVKEEQRAVNEGRLTYNQAIRRLYGEGGVWHDLSGIQTSDFEALALQHHINETAPHRVVGLVVETRPDTVTAANLTTLRRLGCTKVQMGIQSLDPDLLKSNNRAVGIADIRESFSLLRLFGFKIHVHFMLNLYGASPEQDKEDYLRLVTERAYLPDEVKLYPCALVGGTKLCELYAEGSWRPYREDELLDVLATDVLNTPEFTRISRMIRDISAHDIVAGNKKANLRQLVEQRIEKHGGTVSEIRYREISTGEVDLSRLTVETVAYETSVSKERFLQWVTPENSIAGFLRLSLPKPGVVRERLSELPIGPHEAMIREVHIYGRVAELHESGNGAQHLGLGKKLIEAACEIAREQGYEKINVISSVGTREYYRNLGFEDGGLYQRRELG